MNGSMDKRLKHVMRNPWLPVIRSTMKDELSGRQPYNMNLSIHKRYLPCQEQI